MAMLANAAQSGRLKLARRRALQALSLTYAFPRVLLPVRTELPALLNRRRLLGCGAEVGVATGDFSEHILRHWEGRCLISIDPWLEVPADEYVDITNAAQEVQEWSFAHTQRRLEQFGERSAIWRTTSVAGARRLPNGTLDFVYIDARHDYDSVSEDLREWFSKVRPGGVIAGHDYFDGDIEQGTYGVESAVRDFFASRRLHVSATFADGPWRSWLVFVPRRKR